MRRDPGLVLFSTSKAATDCGEGGDSYSLSGAGTIQLDRVVVPNTSATTCSHFTFTDLELQSSTGKFRITGTLKVRNPPVAPPSASTDVTSAHVMRRGMT